jgi:hypothetical protein
LPASVFGCFRTLQPFFFLLLLTLQFLSPFLALERLCPSCQYGLLSRSISLICLACLLFSYEIVSVPTFCPDGVCLLWALLSMRIISIGEVKLMEEVIKNRKAEYFAVHLQQNTPYYFFLIMTLLMKE